MAPPPESTDVEPVARRSPNHRLRWAIAFAVVAIAVPVILAIASAEGGSGPGPFPTLAPGSALDTAPDFSADLFSGGTFSLSDHQAADGRPVLLNLWASWCFPCREEMPAIDAVAKRHPEVLFIGVAVDDDADAARAFAESIGVSYLLGIDETDRVHSAYPAPGLPVTVLISADGKIVGKFFGGAGEAAFEDLLALLG